MKLRAIIILILYQFATFGIVAALFRALEPDALKWMLVVCLMFSAPKSGGEISLLSWVFILVWLGWPLLLPFAQMLAMPLLARSTAGSHPQGGRALIVPSLAAGLMNGWVIVGVGVVGMNVRGLETTIACGVIAVGIIVWIGWTFYSLRKGRGVPPMDAYTEQCRRLLKVGLAWLLFAGVAFALSWKVHSGMNAFLATMGALCILSFACQPAAFSFLMRPRKERRTERDQDACGLDPSTSMRFKRILVLVLYLTATLGLNVLLWVGVLTAEQTGYRVGTFSPIEIISNWLLFSSEVYSDTLFRSELCWLALLIAQSGTIPFLLQSTRLVPLNARALLVPTIASGLLAAFLVIGAGWTFLFWLASDYETKVDGTTIAAGLLAWVGWVFVWLRKDRQLQPLNRFLRQCRFLSSICAAWLLMAVAAHFLPGEKPMFESASLYLAVTAFCAISFAFQPTAFLFFMRYWKKRAKPVPIAS